VHLHGRLEAIEDAGWLRRLVERLTTRHEAARTQPWAVGDAPADYIEQMLKAIVGIRIQVTRVEAKWKLGQNRSAADRAGVAQGLAAQGADAGMGAMAKLVSG
jgi:transcriptional regulator